METSRNKFTNFICVLFCISLATLFCFSIGIRFGIANIVSRAIIAAIYCGIVVGLAFALNKVVNKALSKGVVFDGDKVFKISLIIDVISFIILRLLIIADVIKIDFKKTNIFSIAKIGDSQTVFIDFSNIDNLFATILSASFKLFGNTFLPVYLIQFIISGIAFALILISVYKIFGRFSAGFTGFVIAVSPVFFRNIASSGSDNLIVLMLSVVLILTAKYKDSIEVKGINVFLSLLIGLFTGLFSLYSTLLALSVLIPIVLLWDCRNEYFKDRLINTFVIVVGHLIAFGAGLITSSYLVEKSGVLGFAQDISAHINFRFSFVLNPSYLQTLAEDTCVFLLLVVAIIYCVLYWKNEDDVAHIASFAAVLFMIQLCGFGVNNYQASAMILSLLLMIIGGYGLSLLGYTDSVRVYRIDDDMQPAVIQSIDDKPVNIEINVNNEDNHKSSDERNTSEISSDNKKDEVLGVDSKLDLVYEENSVNIERTDETNDEYIDNTLVASEINSDVVISESEEIDINNQTESKYTEPEVRKTSDYGINNADFESLFSGTNNLPKFVYNDIFTDDLEIDAADSDEENDISKEDEESVDTSSVDTEVIENEEISEDIEAEEKIDDSKDKKAYVDSFFGYLYGEDGGNFEAFEPLKPLDDIEEIKEEPVVEEYVSHADKFADLELDLGFDAFDNVNVSSEDETPITEEVQVEETPITEEVQVEETPITEEVQVEETPIIEYASVEETDSTVDIPAENNADVIVNEDDSEYYFLDNDDGFSVEESAFEEEVIQSDSFDIIEETNHTSELELADDEISLEETLEKKIDEDFSYEDALNRKIENEEIEKEIGFSFEQALERKLDVEESINNALMKDEFSFEETLGDKLIAEDAIEEAVLDDNISVVHTLSNKIKLDEILVNNASEDDFSIQEAIETKIDVERSIENATNEKMLEEFGDEKLFEGVIIDFSGETVSDVSASSIESVNNDVVDKAEDIEADNSTVVNSDDNISDDNVGEDSNEEIKFIENPLPLPKKHVHREMDYGRVIPSAWMHYDIEIDNKNNHYDI